MREGLERRDNILYWTKDEVARILKREVVKDHDSMDFKHSK